MYGVCWDAGGLGATDFLGHRNTFGGIASEFYDGVAKAYQTNYVRSIEPHVGNPEKVTIAGQSSGANAVHYLLTSPVAKGLFRGAIAVSFPCDYLTRPHQIPFVRQKEENGVAFAKVKDCQSLAELRRIPALELIAPDPAVATFAASLPAMFGENRAAFLAKQDAFLALCGSVTTDQEAREMAKLAQIEYRLSSLFYPADAPNVWSDPADRSAVRRKKDWRAVLR